MEKVEAVMEKVQLGNKQDSKEEQEEEDGRLDIDFHELNTCYKLHPVLTPPSPPSPTLSSSIQNTTTNRNDDRDQVYSKMTNFSVVLSLNDQISQRIQNISSGSSSVYEGTIQVQIHPTYPSTPPTIKLLFKDYADKLKPYLRKQRKDEVEDELLILDINHIYKWSPETSTLLDLVNLLDIWLESHILKSHINHVVIRDFAYPLHSNLHWGRYTLRPDQIQKKVKAIYDFEAQDENELAFNVGDLIDVVYERDDGWLVGMMNGLSGLVPINHIERLP